MKSNSRMYPENCDSDDMLLESERQLSKLLFHSTIIDEMIFKC